MSHPDLVSALLPALDPCRSHVDGPCRSLMKWDPSSGHMPRGFGGANAKHLSAVRLMIVTAEPGDPADGESYVGPAHDMLRQHIGFFEQSLRSNSLRRDGRGAPYHKNLLTILALCWQDASIDEQLERTWLTNSVLCSAEVSGGNVPRPVEMACAQNYLKRQVELLPQAFVLALGESKARNRLIRAGVRCDAWAQHPSARPNTNPAASWASAAAAFHAWLREQGAYKGAPP